MESKWQVVDAWFVPDDLGTKRVMLRAWETGDADWLMEGFSDPSVQAQTEQEDGLTVDGIDVAVHMVQTAQRAAKVGDRIGLAICLATDGEPVGSVELDAIPGEERSAEIGFWVLAPYRRHGFAREAVAIVTRWALGTLGLTAVWAEVGAGNPASLGLLRATGFQEPGRIELPAHLPTRRSGLVLVATPQTAEH